MPFSDKQQEYLENAVHRWNVKTGATRSGKTFLDFACVIPKRILNCTGDGLIMLLGNTKNTLERNVLKPMRNIWGSELVGNIGSNNTVMLFGKECHALGADKINQVSKLQGAGLEYCYGDEVTTWNEEVFDMLKSRLDKPSSCFDGTCNPKYPNHWFKKFIDSDADVFHQSYKLDDNPFNDEKFVQELKKEYQGTVYYDRYILGRWVSAEGIIYRLFADNPQRYMRDMKKYLLESRQNLAYVLVGVDWGHSSSANAAVAVGITRRFKEVLVLDEYYEDKELDIPELMNNLISFLQGVIYNYGPCYVYGDNAEQMVVRTLKNTCRQKGLRAEVAGCEKPKITDRIVLENALFGLERIKIAEHCGHIKEAFSMALWDEKSSEDERLDDGTSNIDSLDAFEYAIANVMGTIEQAGHVQ